MFLAVSQSIKQGTGRFTSAAMGRPSAGGSDYCDSQNPQGWEFCCRASGGSPA